MNDTRDRRTARAGPLAILMDCPSPTCDGRITLHGTRRSAGAAIGSCPTCGSPAVLHDGVLEPRASEPGRRGELARTTGLYNGRPQ